MHNWTGAGHVLVNLEGHGREAILPEVDIYTYSRLVYELVSSAAGYRCKPDAGSAELKKRRKDCAGFRIKA
ncbi:hypothetical protein [Paenibacillus sp. Mc5Re-14]|uniref:hypothetical protein n=1 Tax=Paenibacillus sp. Mc5Re-14 TaxID=1030529 RepID=UPI000A506049|nr:hypothetical protein [Paenibacillus sp. Mc5Re-14]